MSVYSLPKDNTYCAHEEELVKYWDVNNIYSRILAKNTDGPKYCFVDGPPFVSSNVLHFGHLMIGSLKSTCLNFKQMDGYDCMNELGYDCHGLPIEMVANKQLGISTKKEVEDYGIDKYNRACKDMINSYSGAWKPIYQRIGRFADFENNYKTMDTNFMESVWWTFSELWKKNLIYKGYQVMPYSNACNSPLSNFEAGQNYKDVETRTIYVLLKALNYENTYYVAWTTTPWTLPSNLALCVNSNAIYCFVNNNDKTYIVEENYIQNLDLKGEVTIINKCLGKDLVGNKYVPLFPTQNSFPSENKHTIIADDFVIVADKSTTGTGIVHIAPFYGEDDYRVCMANNIINHDTIEYNCTVDDNGKFLNTGIPELDNNLVTDKSTNDTIIKMLKINGDLLKTQMYTHSYPYCYRTDTPLIYKAMSSYFVAVTKLKSDLLNNNSKVTWHPENIGYGRFKSWLENVKDWGVSRNRFFGTPLPVWISDDGSETVCVSSIDELVELANLTERPTDLHRETIDTIEIPSKKNIGTTLKNVRLVLDCWFESGCVPIAQKHYPFENPHIFDDKEYLCDFIAEGLDQTRGWFYTLMVISTGLFNKPAFKDVICTGLILDDKGQKFSKKYGNFKDPFEVLNKHGSDVIRLYLLNSPTLNADPLLFNESHIEKVKQRLIPYINAIELLITHIKDLQSKNNTFDINLWKSTDNIIDKWIISMTHSLITNVRKAMDNYQVDTAIKLLLAHIENITNWYIKLSRDRIRGLNTISERSMALSVLYFVISNYMKLMAPFAPFLSEHLYKHIKELDTENLESIHLCKLPDASTMSYDKESVQKFNVLEEVIKNIRTLRLTLGTHTSMKIPIYKALIFHNDSKYLDTVKFFEEVICEEINSLELVYNNLEDNLKYRVIPDNKAIGKKHRANAAKVKEFITNMDNTTAKYLYDNKPADFSEYHLEPSDYTIELVPSSEFSNDTFVSRIDGPLMISVDKRYTEELHNIYQLHKLGTSVQRLRKNTNLNPWNKIIVNFKCSDKLKLLIDNYIKSISERLLCQVTCNGNYLQEMYATSTYDYEFADETIETISYDIYLV